MLETEKTSGAASSIFPPQPATPARRVARPLVWVTLAFILGLAAPAWGLRIPGGWLLGGALVLWGLLALAWCRRRRAGWLPLVFFWLLGMAFYQQAEQPRFAPESLTHLPVKEELIIKAQVDRHGRIGPQGVQMRVTASAWLSPAGWRPLSGRLLVTAPPLTPPGVGEAVVLRTRLRLPRALKNPGSFNQARYLAADGIFRVASLRSPVDLMVLADAGAAPLRERLRGSIRELLQELSPGPRAVYLAMLLGDQGEITPERRRDFSRTGTSHLLVINGMHLAAVAAVAYFLCFWGLRRFPRLLLRLNAVQVSTLVSAVPVVAYAWMAGGSPSTQRAEIMVLACLLLLFLGRPREVWSALALAALIILALSPLRLFTISFQLSFTAVAALLYFLPRWFREAGERLSPPGLKPKLLLRVRLWVKEAALVSLVATLATAPLVAAYFQVVSLLGAGVNLVAIPLVLFLALPLGEAAVLAQSLHLTPVAQGLLFLGQIPLWLGCETIALAARLPGSAITAPIPTWWQIAAYFLFWVMLFPPRRRRWTWTAAALAAGVLAASVLFPWIHTSKDLEITCLDTGGSLAGVAVTPEGQRLVFAAPGASWPGQAGGGPGPLPGYLHWRQFRRLDEVVALRLAQGNAPEMLALARDFRVGQFWYGRRGPEGPAYYELLNFLGDARRSPRSLEKGGPPVTLGSVRLAFRPIGERSLALQLTYRGRVVLIVPPGARLRPGDWSPDPGTRTAALLLPGKPVPDLAALARSLNPEIITIYGQPPDTGEAGGLPPGSRYLRTRAGAVTLVVSAAGATGRQWTPGDGG